MSGPIQNRKPKRTKPPNSGRKKGVPNKLREGDKEILAALKDIDTVAMARLPVTYQISPKMVLLGIMEHQYNLGILYVNRAYAAAEKSGGEEGRDMELSDTLHKVGNGLLMMAADNAAKVAPYIHAKVDGNAPDQTNPFVFRLPPVSQDANAWASDIGSAVTVEADHSEVTIEQPELDTNPNSPSEEWLERVARERKSA